MDTNKQLRRLSLQPSPVNLSNLFDTDSQTSYHIPRYQRDFKWKDSEVSDFIADVLASYELSQQRFFGTLLLSDDAPNSDQSEDAIASYVIDGQQRLTTSLLILVAIRHLTLEVSGDNKDGQKLATRINDRITLPNDFENSSKPREPRLVANRTNSEFMSLVLREATESRLVVEQAFDKYRKKLEQKRTKPLYDAYLEAYRSIRNFVVKKVRVVDIDEEVDEKLEQYITTDLERAATVKLLTQLTSHFLNASIFIKIQIPKWDDAFELFDGLNNRGMELAKKDVLKNLLLSRAAKHGEAVVARVESNWQELDDLTELFSTSAETTFTRFLRHWMLLKHENVTLSGVTRLLISTTRDEEVEVTINNLSDAALHYHSIARPNKEHTPDSEILRRLNALRLLTAERVRPIILAMFIKGIEIKSQQKILNALENLQFRRSAICQQDNKTLEKSVQSIASKLFASGESAVDSAIKSIRALNPNKEIFASNFKAKSGMPDGVAVYMLLRIENHLRAKHGQPALDAGDVTLEHILPQSPDKHWDMKSSNPEVKTLIGRIGNLTLLTQPMNSKVSNLAFDKKKAAYGKESDVLFITKSILDKKVWTQTEIAARQEELGAVAAEVWPS